MKKILAVISLSFLLFSCATKIPQGGPAAKTPPVSNVDKNAAEVGAVSEDFVQGSEDIPLLVGMEKMFDEGLGFDSEEGSIMSSSYQSKIDLEKVKLFYCKTLPQMGWTLVKSDKKKTVFKRDKEKLEIEFICKPNKEVVKFFISSSL